MDEEKYQKELFEFEQPKKSFSRFADMLPKADFEGRVAITISLEKIVFIAIGIVMAMVIIYALGVESGKSRVRNGAHATKPVAAPSVSTVPQLHVVSIPAKSILNTEPIVSVVKPAAPSRSAIQNQIKTDVGNNSSKPFTIMAGAFSKLVNAETSAIILTRQGLNSTVTYVKPYYRVYVGAYVDKNAPEARNDMIRVRRIYKDAMFKLR